MAYGTKYIMSFNNNLDEFYEVYFEYLGYTGFSTPITGDDNCVTIRATTGDENKMEPIVGHECLINVFVNQNQSLTIADFTATVANNIRITVYKEKNYSNPYFQGFVAIDKMSQPFLDPPYTISIRALDGLGLLKGVDLVDLNHQKFYGNYNVITWIGNVLYKTDQTMPIRVYFNWYNTTFSTSLGVFEQTFLNSSTFSQGDSFVVNSTDPSVDTAATTADDCYTCLEKIIRCFRCKLFQQDGYWHIVNLYEYANPAGYAYTEYTFGDTSSGTVVMNATGRGTGLTYNVPIGKKQLVFPVNTDQSLVVNQPLKWVQLNYTYDQSQNKICNQDLQDVDLTQNPVATGVYSSIQVDPTGGLNNGYTPSGNPILYNMPFKEYPAFCWTHLNAPVSNPVAPNKTGTIRIVYDQNGFEYERYLKLEETNVLTWFQTSPLPVSQYTPILVDPGDKFQLSASFRTKNSITGGNDTELCYVLLYADDGTRWSLHANPTNETADPMRWVQSNSNFSTNLQFVHYNYQGANANLWINFSLGTIFPIVPRQGKIVVLFGCNIVNAQEYWYKDITFTVTPFISGTAAEIKGDYNYTTSANNLSIRQSENDTIEISDSPKRYFKGALIDVNNKLLPPSTNGVNPTGGWYLAGSNPNSYYRFTGIMNLLLYNNQYRPFNEIEGTFKGLTYLNNTDATDIRPNGFLNTYYFVDGNFPTKRFMCTSYEKHLATGEWNGVFVEVTRNVNDNGFLIPSGYPLFNYTF